MRRIALIGGTGSARLVPANATEMPLPPTPWGTPSGPVSRWQVGSREVLWLPRHGRDGRIAPHRVNYRANIDALRALAVDAVVGVNAVGGITAGTWPGRVVLPDQLIDYTWGREHSFFDGATGRLEHVDFDPPFDVPLRARLAAAARGAGVDLLDGATYGVTQGPRLETAAEVARLAADGCHVVGMTAMPEAGLAREAALPYAICAIVVNHAAGRLPAGQSIHGEMREVLARGLADLEAVVAAFLEAP